MSDVSYRNWDIWKNTKYFKDNETFPGYYECILIPHLMVRQTVEFLAEKFQVSSDIIIRTQGCPPELILHEITTADGNLCIKIRDILSTSVPMEEIIQKIVNTLDAISVCVDIALVCNTIRFIADTYGQIFIANRKPLGRAMSFEVEERDIASQKLLQDFPYYVQAPEEMQVSMKHYLTGLLLLSLEDQVSGLIDAAYIQFCQSCEAISNCSDGNLSTVAKYIAQSNLKDTKVLQIIAHHVWQVRNKYYGHGDIEHNMKAIRTFSDAYQASKQVLVARYLCKRLIDISAPSSRPLIREMRFYPERGSEEFRGTVEELSENFRVDYPGRTAKIYDADGNNIDKYHIL